MNDTLGQRGHAGVVAGVCPVLETPFLPDDRVDYDGFVRVVDYVIAAGAQSVMFPAFASEFLKLTDAERDSLIAVVLDRARTKPGFTCVIAVTDHATAVAVERARAAVQAGAGAINLLPPHALAPSRRAVLEHVLAVAQAVSPVPVIVQYAPHQTGTNLDLNDLRSIALASTNVVQIKVESTPPGQLIEGLKQGTPRLGSLIGYAGVQALDAFRRGADGVMPGCSFVELYLRLWDLWQAGRQDAAEVLHGRMLPYLSYWMQSSELIVAAEKEISRRRGIIDSARCRAPAYTLDNQEYAMIDRFLVEFADELDKV